MADTTWVGAIAFECIVIPFPVYIFGRLPSWAITWVYAEIPVLFPNLFCYFPESIYCKKHMTKLVIQRTYDTTTTSFILAHLVVFWLFLWDSQDRFGLAAVWCVCPFHMCYVSNKIKRKQQQEEKELIYFKINFFQ